MATSLATLADSAKTRLRLLPPVGGGAGAGGQAPPELTPEELEVIGGNAAAPLLPPIAGMMRPRVTNPLEEAIERQQERVTGDLKPQTPWRDLSGMGKVGRVLGTIGQVAGNTFAPRLWRQSRER